MPDSDTMDEDEISELLDKHQHLSVYINAIKMKIGMPKFYKTLPKSVVSIHINGCTLL